MVEREAEGSSGNSWSRSDGWLALAVGVIAVLPFTPALWGPFIYDDRLLILANPYIRSFHHWQHWFTAHFWDAGLEEIPVSPLVYYRPLITASYSLDWKVGGGSPLVFHGTNLLWQGLCSVLAYATARRWLGSAPIAVVATLIFALHPTKVESVAWISGRTDMFCAAGMLLACTGVAVARQRRWVAGSALEVFGTIFAYLSKETAMALPVLVAMETWFARGRRPIRGSELAALLRASFPQALVASAYWLLRAILLPVVGRGGWDLDLGERVLIVLETMGRITELVLLPVRLSIQQGLVRVEAGHPVFSAPYLIIGGFSTAVLLVVAWRARIRQPLVTMGVVALGGTLLPTLNVVPTLMVTMVSERFLYLPTLVVAIVVAGVMQDAKLRRWAGTGALMLGLLYATRSALRSHEFSDEHSFWVREHRLNPQSVQAITELARISRDARRFDESLSLYLQGQEVANLWFPYLRAGPEFVLLAADLVAQQTPDAETESIRVLAGFFRSVASGSPSQPATVSIRQMRFSLALPEDREHRRPYELRARRSESLCWSRVGDDAEAVSVALRLTADCPSCTGAVRDAALVLARAGKYDEALAALAALPWNRGGASRSMIETARSYRQASATTVGPASVVARAQELAVLLAWGRAYDALAPYRADFCQSPAICASFGELAWRAGHFSVARAVLAEHWSQEEVNERVWKWSLEMGWTAGVPRTHGM
jgi:hypothetical protein